jgi:hypothetical protein
LKNQYCGDVGDYSKFALLRSIQRAFPKERVGVVWYLTPDDPASGTGKDGRFIDYPELEPCDPELYTALHGVAHGRRHISEFRKLGLTEKMSEYDQQLDGRKHARRTRQCARDLWFQGALVATVGCSFVFLDPDNGIASDRVQPKQAQCDKFVLASEVRALHARDQTVVCYQHATRHAGGFDRHLAEIAAKFPRSFAIRWHPVQARAYLVWPASGRDLLSWAETLVAGPWGGRFSLGPVPLS